MRAFYLLLSIAGLLLPYSQFIPWLLDNGLDMGLFICELFANRIGGFFGLDVVVSALVLIPFVFVEGRRLGVKRLWLPVVGTLLVGVSFGLPLFLFLRESQLQQATAGHSLT